MQLDMQREFARALLDPVVAVPASLSTHNSPSPSKRFAVYRNNVVVSLIDALAARFPATERIVGTEFFRAAAGVYVRRHPPRSRILMFYGDSLPEFLAGFPPAADVPYLSDVARLEAARTHAYHAADAEPADGTRLQQLEEEGLGALRIRPHPSVAVLRSRYPVVTIWSMNAGERDVAPIESWDGEDALVARPRGDVEVRLLPPGGATFLSRLFTGAALSDAADTAQAETDEFNLVASLAVLLAAGVTAEFIVSDREPVS
jgi:hypothetical protein